MAEPEKTDPPADPPEKDEAEEKAYSTFAKFLNRYQEENKPADPPPEKTKKPSGGFLDGLLNF